VRGLQVEAEGVIKFACVDGPDFDGHKINLDSLTLRLRHFISEEDRSHNLWDMANWHKLISRPKAADQIIVRRIPEEDQEHAGGCCSI